jgi:uncharacterized repeat protein (TIGR02543 family)
MKNVKKWLGLLLALVLVCSLLPVGAMSALAEGEGETPEEPQEPTAYNLWIGGVQVTDETLSGAGWSYDPASKTLTLTDAKIADGYHEANYYTNVIYSESIDLTLVLNGANKVGKDGVERGIWVDEGALTVKGSGSLDVRGASNGIVTAGGITFESGTVTVTGENAWGITTNGTVTVNGGKLTVVTNNASVDAYSAVICKGFTLGAGMGVTEPDEWELTNFLPNYYDFAKDGAAVKKLVIEPLPTYTVTVSAEPAEGGTVTADPTSGTEGTEISLTATPNEGYSFQEWQVVSGGVTVENDKFTLGAENVELKALFVPQSCTVSFDPNGGSGEMAAVTVNYGEKYKLPENGFTAPADKEFDKWDLGAPGDEIDVTGDLTVKALWKDKTAVTFTVSFDPVGGSGTMADVSVTQGEKYKLPDCSFTPPEGKTFDKWDLGAPGEEIEVTSDLVLKAVWKTATYTVSFNTTGGSYIADQIVEYGKIATEPATDPTRTGYTFDCWCTDKTGTQIFDFNTPIKKDTILYAKWNQAPKYTVVSGGGKVYAKSSGQDLVITVKRNPKDTECFKHFTGVEIDGKALVKDTDFTAEAGSTVVTLKPACLSKLNTGRHIITINFDDGKATTGLTVKAGKTGGGGGGGGKGGSPETGDPFNPALWTGLLLLSGAALGGVIVCGRKSRRGER